MTETQSRMMKSIIERSTEKPIRIAGDDIICATNRDRQIARHIVDGFDLFDHVADREERCSPSPDGFEYITTWRYRPRTQANTSQIVSINGSANG